jgi:uncharacterized protein YdeI (YjbR/CyaY-like superfamily)
MDSLYLTRRPDWRAWLRKNHQSEKVVWLRFYKKATGKPTLPYDDALNEALCWGWIDSLVRRIDEECYAQKFTPRANAGKWSASNIERMRALIVAGQVQKPGMAVISPEVLKQVRGRAKPARRPEPAMPSELSAGLAKNAEARAFFDSLAPSCRRNYQAWVGSAVKEETRQRRVSEALRLLAQKQKLGLK